MAWLGSCRRLNIKKVEGNMNKEKLNQLNDLIADIYEADAAALTPETSFSKDLNADSLKRTIFSAELEDLTDVSLSVAKLLYTETVGDLYKELEGWLAQ